MKVETGIVKKHYQLFIGKITAKIQELYTEADGNYMGLERKGVEERSPEIVLVFEIQPWIPTAAPMTELVDSHSRSDDTWFLFCQFLTL